MSAGIEALEVHLEHSFSDRDLLRRALTHKSLASEKNGGGGDNEQLEFLGDSVLGFLASEILVRRFPGSPEGRLSKLKASLVSATHLHEVAQKLELGDHLLLGRGEEMSGGRAKKALLANAVEALIAALYLDGGMQAARRFVEASVVGVPNSGDGGDEATDDFKSALQEMAQALKLPQPRYSTVEERGPEHAKTFTVEVRVGRDLVSRAEGVSKKSAGQNAAKQILERIGDAQGRVG